MGYERQVALMNRQRIDRALQRIAYQIVEDAHSDATIVLAGIEHRGFAVAGALQHHLQSIIGMPEAPVKLTVKKGEPNISDTDASRVADIENAYLVLVDDVIFSGKTMFKALRLVASDELDGEIHVAVLVDRGHRTLPVLARFVGIDIPTKLNEHVAVELDENDALDRVVLYKAQSD
mgnify:CR=1 FL=1